MGQISDYFDKVDIRYYGGWKNRAIRYYFYINRGLQMFNEFRYLLMAIFALYWSMKVNNLFVLFGLFIISCIFLGIVGYLTVHHIGKVIDYLSIQFSTVWSKYTMSLNEEIRDLLRSIDGKVK